MCPSCLHSRHTRLTSYGSNQHWYLAYTMKRRIKSNSAPVSPLLELVWEQGGLPLVLALHLQGLPTKLEMMRRKRRCCPLRLEPGVLLVIVFGARCLIHSLHCSCALFMHRVLCVCVVQCCSNNASSSLASFFCSPFLNQQTPPSVSFANRIKAKAAKRRKDEQQQQKQETQRQATRTADPEFGTFEKFTKGEERQMGLRVLCVLSACCVLLPFCAGREVLHSGLKQHTKARTVP